MEVLKRHLASEVSPIRNYALLQAAVAAECFDTSAPTFPFFVFEPPITPDSFWGYASSVKNALSGKMANFYNRVDFGVVAAWQPNQLQFKPDARYFYQYLPIGPHQTPPGWPIRAVTDPHELMSFMSRPRTKAVGALANLDASIFPTQLDLQALVGFDAKWDCHSGEFNWNIQRLGAFYSTLLNRLQSP